MHVRRNDRAKSLVLLAGAWLLFLALPLRGPEPGAMLDQGIVAFDTPDFSLRLVKSSQTVASLKPKAASGFDFAPGDLLAERYRDGFRHLGDLELRLRVGGAGEWQTCSTAAARRPVRAVPVNEPLLAQADLGPTLPEGCPLQVTRTWLVEDGKLVLRFQLKNGGNRPVQVGALEMPMVFNNVLSQRELDEAHALCSFTDPYIGGGAGYVQVTRLSGRGPALLVVPEPGTPLEAWNPLLSDPTPRGHTFEGFHAWVVHSRAYAESEWRGARPWNPPTSLALAPGETRNVGVRFLLSPGVREIEGTLAANGRPVAIGVPGYILPMGTDARLFLRHSRPVRSLQAEPAGAIEVDADPAVPGDPLVGDLQGWQAYTLRGRSWGRARLRVTYEDGLEQALHYFVTKPQAEAVADLGRFLFTRQWFADERDPFGRGPSIMTYDREKNRIVTQDSRVWIAGLGDEGGSSWLAGAMKLFGRPDRGQAAKLEEFIDKVLWGRLQISEGDRKYGVRKSLFYYQPERMPPGTYRSDLDWSSWTSWNQEHSESLERSFDYPHVAALHWAMYRLARGHDGLVVNHPWQWYLENARQTALAMLRFAPYYSQFGNMEGSVFVEILRDLRREGLEGAAAELEARMRGRYAAWRAKAYPFGSEMPWDSTGQEEVHAWSRHFGDEAKARVCLDAVLAYMPAVPHWGYHGSARRYWDFLYAGKLRRVERQLHHYGSGLNAIPVLDEYRRDPDDFHLLRVGYAGAMGALAAIDRGGFASCAFHSFPDTLRFDPLSGDYAQNFFGHAMNAAAYLVRHREFGWLAFGGSVQADAGRVALVPTDSFRRRAYLAPLGLWLTLEAGHFERVEMDPASGLVRLGLGRAGKFTPQARLRVEQPARIAGVRPYSPAVKFRMERGAYVVPLRSAITWVELSDR